MWWWQLVATIDYHNGWYGSNMFQSCSVFSHCNGHLKNWVNDVCFNPFCHQWQKHEGWIPFFHQFFIISPIVFPTSKMAQLQSYTAGLAIAVGFFGHGGSNNVPWRCRPGGWTWEISQKKSRCISLGKRGKIMGKWWENMIGNWVQWWTIHGDSSQTCKVSNKPVNILRSQMLIYKWENPVELTRV